jgi:predicted enzyme related to lactoylglutathione lyase
MAVYLEIVSNDVDTLTGLYQGIHGVSFGPPDPDLGQARVASQADEGLIGIRKPLAAHEQPIMRAYLAVEDIQQAVKTAEESGAVIAYPPTRQGNHGTFAIVIQGDVETRTLATLAGRLGRPSPAARAKRRRPSWLPDARADAKAGSA